MTLRNKRPLLRDPLIHLNLNRHFAVGDAQNNCPIKIWCSRVASSRIRHKLSINLPPINTPSAAPILPPIHHDRSGAVVRNVERRAIVARDEKQRDGGWIQLHGKIQLHLKFSQFSVQLFDFDFFSTEKK